MDCSSTWMIPINGIDSCKTELVLSHEPIIFKDKFKATNNTIYVLML